ncbi:MAG: FtsW/RodA/SpoVE family cell cycle protein, partial [Proteobacteria bacterium]|nr:FtsW/RodA/SpoVE family cell cycle protein [Pseudomonadota bacterium]
MVENVLGGPQLTLRQKLWQIHWLFVLMLIATAAVGFAMLYSAGEGSVDPWAKRHAVRFGFGIMVMIAVAVIDTRIWLRYAYAIYFVVLVLLVVVEIGGATGMGARRWINAGFFNLQPSELMKIAMVLALARYFHGCSLEDIRRPVSLITPILIVAA